MHACLSAHTYYSFRFGTLSVQQLLETARNKDVSVLALADINNTSAILDFFRLAPEYNVEPVAGVDFRNGAKQEFIGLAANSEGFFELNHFLSKCLKSGNAVVPAEAPQFHNVFIIYPLSNVPKRPLRDNEFIGVRPYEINKIAFSDWKNYTSRLLAFTPVNFRDKKDFNTHRLLRSIDNNTLLSKLHPDEVANPADCMPDVFEMQRAYGLFPQLINNTQYVLSQCRLRFEYHTNKNKQSFTGSKSADRELLRSESFRGLGYRFGKNPNHPLGFDSLCTKKKFFPCRQR
jgi:DNA polymerase-3 subunit alpha